MEIFKKLVSLENQLHSCEVRNSKTKLNILLSDQFNEIGASGKMFTKNEVIEYILKSKQIKIMTYDYKLFKLSSSIMQLIYKEKSQLDENNYRYTLRSSLWKMYGNNWKMIFHQGTVVNQPWINAQSKGTGTRFIQIDGIQEL